MKQQINWQGQDLNIRSRDLKQLAESQFELPRKRSATGSTEIIKTMGIHNWTQTSKGTFTRTFCQKNKGPVKVEQIPIKMDSGTIHRTLSSKGTPLVIGTDE
jgi:hypothetical protein